MPTTTTMFTTTTPKNTPLAYRASTSTNPNPYFNEDYDEEREMEPRPEPARAVTPPLRATSLRVRRRRERVVGPHREKREWKPLQSSLTFAYRGQPLPNNIRGNLPPNEDYPLPDVLKMPSHIGSYNGKGDPNNFLHLFEGAIKMQKWLMVVACHMFTYTLKDSARIWWNSQKAACILDYEHLKTKF
ncbi:hypothetical protein Tco_0899343 [Tanacetum coccineum]